MTEPFKIKKYGMNLTVSDEFLLYSSGFEQKGHWVEIPLTDQDRAAHARAEAAVAEIENNPWIQFGYDSDFSVEPLKPKVEFVPEETKEEWMTRWKEAGHPTGRMFDLG
jgi:hypothetical protein